MKLPTRQLGQTGLEVTEIGYGAFELRGARSRVPRPHTDAEADRILNAVLDSGANLIDTAPVYGPSERQIGRFIGDRRDEYILATKCGQYLKWAGETDEGFQAFTRDDILRGVTNSLNDLRTDHIDIMQTHNVSFEDAQSSGMVDVLQELKDSGLVRFIGASVHPTRPEFERFIDWGVFDLYQVQWSALDRKRESLITKAAETGAGVILRSVAAFGDPEVAGGRTSEGMWNRYREAGLDELRDEGESRTAFLIRYALAHPHYHTAIIGTMNLEHWTEDIAAIRRGPLPNDTVAEIQRRMDEVGETVGEG